MSRFFPLSHYDSGTQKGHGRIEQRMIDVLPIEATGEQDQWPTARQVCRIRRIVQRKKKGVWSPVTEEVVYLITSVSADKASPKELLALNRNHWGIEVEHRNKDVFLGEDQRTNRKDNAPSVLFVLNNLALSLLGTICHSPTKAIEACQNDRNIPIRMCS